MKGRRILVVIGIVVLVVLVAVLVIRLRFERDLQVAAAGSARRPCHRDVAFWLSAYATAR